MGTGDLSWVYPDSPSVAFHSRSKVLFRRILGYLTPGV